MAVNERGAVSRREFSKAAAVAGIGLAIPTPGVFAAGSDKVRVAMVGAGERGTVDAVYCLKSAPGVELVAIADLFQDRVDAALAKLNAEVQVRTAARAILTNKKRIDAADKNVELQTKKVEAEQKKFENGMSTSFQVLEFQEDLTTARGDRNRALVDYRKSIAALEQARGTLDEYLKVSIQ